MLRKFLDRGVNSEERIEVELVEPENFYTHHIVNHIEEVDDKIFIYVKDFGKYEVTKSEVVVDESLGKCIKVTLDRSLDAERFYDREYVDPYFNGENYNPEDDFVYDYLLRISKILEVNFVEEMERSNDEVSSL